MDAVVETLLSLAVVAFAVGWAVPFVARIVTQRSVAGVSPTAVTVTFFSAAGWAVLGLAEGNPEIVLSSAIYISGCLAALALGLHYRWTFPWIATAAGGAALVGAFAIGGPGGVGFVVLMFAAVRFTAQVVTVWRSDDISGMSLVAWVVAGTEGLVWLVAYAGVFPLVWQAALWGAVALGSSTAIVVKIRLTRTKEAKLRKIAVAE